MAIYTDFFIAEPDEIPRLFFPNDLQRRPTLASKNILPDTLADLDFILTGETERKPRLIHESGELQVYALAPELSIALADLPKDRLSDVVQEWGHGDAGFLQALCDLADQSLASGKCLYVYI